jgi:SAM-dependent MidA family methyltransferase
MWGILQECGARRMRLVEVAAGDGRLTRDILDAAASHHPGLYAHLDVTPVERSAAARARHPAILAAHGARYAGSRTDVPSAVTGVILANELLDAMPVHVVLGAASGPREIYVGERDGELIEIEGPLSTPAVAEYLERERVDLRPGARVEIGVRATDWIREAADALDAGFLLLFDYGLPAAELYSDARPAGTLTTFRRHTSGIDSYLRRPGESDITSHVNLTAIARAAASAGLVPMGMTDQTYFLLQLGIAGRVPQGDDAASIATRLCAKTLLMPGGLGSTMKVLAFGKRVPQRTLRGFSSARLT